jgi:hypothetical protein
MDYLVVQPPSMVRVDPVTCRASSLQRYTTMAPTSFGITNSLEGIFSSSVDIFASCTVMPSFSALASSCASTSGVRTQPGQMALHVIPLPAVSNATTSENHQQPKESIFRKRGRREIHTFVSPTRPCLEATYGAFIGDPTSP